MKLPWVSRDSHEIALLAESKRADSEHENAQYLRRQLSDLASRYHMLLLQGATPTPPTTPMPERPAGDPVMSAVNEACAGKDARVRKAMIAAVNRDRKGGVPDDQIILRIARGNRVADEIETEAPSLPQNPGADRPPS